MARLGGDPPGGNAAGGFSPRSPPLAALPELLPSAERVPRIWWGTHAELAARDEPDDFMGIFLPSCTPVTQPPR